MSTQVLRPATPKYTDYALAAGLVAVISVVFSLIEYPDALPAIVGGTLGALAVGAVVVALYFRVTKVVLEPGRVSHTNLLGYTRRIPADSVATAVYVYQFSVLISMRTRTRRTDSQLFLLDASGRTRLRLRSSLWGDDAVAVVRAAVPGAAAVTHETMDAGTMSAAHPKAVGFLEENPVVVGVVAALVLVAVVAVVVTVVLARP